MACKVSKYFQFQAVYKKINTGQTSKKKSLTNQEVLLSFFFKTSEEVGFFKVLPTDFIVCFNIQNAFGLLHLFPFFVKIPYFHLVFALYLSYKFMKLTAFIPKCKKAA